MTYYIEALTLHLQRPIEELINMVSDAYSAYVEVIRTSRLEKQYREAALALREYEYPNEEYCYVLNLIVNGEFDAKVSK